jgi:Skp family chaperone for outer membrane proteins
VKKLIAILILISFILLSTLIITNSPKTKIVNTSYIYEIVDDHVEKNSTNPNGG